MDLRRSLLLPCLLAFALAGIAAAGQEPAGNPVILTLMQEIQGLAAADVPFGLVLGREDSLALQIWTRPRPPTPPPSRRMLVEQFEQSWAERFQISEVAGVLAVTSAHASTCAPALQREVKGQTITGSPVEVLFAVMRELDPSLQRLPPPGVVSGGGVTSSSPDPVTTVVTVAVPSGSLRKGLDRIVGSTHHLGWAARERCPQDVACRCELSFVTPTGFVYTSYDAAAGRSR